VLLPSFVPHLSLVRPEVAVETLSLHGWSEDQMFPGLSCWLGLCKFGYTLLKNKGNMHVYVYKFNSTYFYGKLVYGWCGCSWSLACYL
jgi:hypothetical protein